MPDNKRNHIEELKRRLYRRTTEGIVKRRKPRELKPRTYGIKEEWSGVPPEEKPKKKKIRIPVSFFKYFFIVALVFFIGALAFTFFSFYSGSNVVSSKNIEIGILGNAFVAGGEELSLQIEVTNRNNASIEFSDLLIEYPRGVGEGDMARERLSIGTIGPGQSVIEDIKLILFGEQGSIQEIRVVLEYRIQGSNAIFVKEKSYPVTISAAPLTLLIDAPLSTVSNQDMTLRITVSSASESVLEDMRLEVSYPPGFTYKSATPEPSLGETLWDLGDLAQGDQKDIVIRGTLLGTEGDERTFRVFSGLEDPRDKSRIGLVYNSFLHTVTIKRPFIEARILVGGEESELYAITSQTETIVDIQWANNLPTRIDDVEIRAKISGNAWDEDSIESQSGFYNSLTQSVIWDKSTIAVLGSVDPGGSGTVSFSFSSLPLLAGQALIENPEIEIEVSIKGRQPAANIFQEVTNVDNKLIKIISDFQLAAQALHYSGPFTNSGPMPPKAERETTYTIVWRITNSSNLISDAIAKTTLPSYVSFTGLTAPPAESISYNETTREVTWDIDRVNRGAGLTGGEREVSFQVSLLPSKSQIGSRLQLILGTSFSGYDTFTQVTIQSTRKSLNTMLSNDPSFQVGQDKVVQ